MGMDDALRAAIGYMMPEGQDVSQEIIALQERVSWEASAASRCVIMEWNGHTPLRPEFGELIASVTRVGKWQEWVIQRSHDGQVWPVLRWEEVPVGHD